MSGFAPAPADRFSFGAFEYLDQLAFEHVYGDR